MRFAKTALPAVVACVLSALGPSTALAGAGSPSMTGGAVAAPAQDPGAARLDLRRGALATWFGPGFYGHRTACGQILEPVLVGVANRTLPCGTLVEVSYVGRRLTVPVVDRGPYSRIGADWDLTSGAARALKITETVRVHAHVVGHVPNSPTLGLPALAVSNQTAAPAAAITGGSSAS
jgi:rare lipoprotein A (peptidoglycan hydrolase)